MDDDILQVYQGPDQIKLEIVVSRFDHLGGSGGSIKAEKLEKMRYY